MQLGGEFYEAGGFVGEVNGLGYYVFYFCGGANDGEEGGVEGYEVGGVEVVITRDLDVSVGAREG